MVTARLENWSIDPCYEMLWGNINDDVYERWPNGKFIHTSYIKGVRDMELKEGDEVVTRNSTYLLGKPLESGE